MLAGLVVALALIPEAISFSIIAGVDPRVGDASTVAALDAIAHKYAGRGKRIEFVGLDEHSAGRYQRHTGQLAAAT